MRIVFAVATLALMTSICNLCNLSGRFNSNDANRNTAAAPSPVTTPSEPSLKDAFPQKVGDFNLDATYERNQLKGDDKLLPGAEDVMGAVYKTSANKKVQVMVGSYASPDEAEAARKKRVPSSQYIARWTKGSMLFVASDRSFRDKI